MMQIRRIRDGAVLREVDTLVRADLAGAQLSGADLLRANLSGAQLSGANLSGARMPSPDMPVSVGDAAHKVAQWLLAGHWLKSKWIDTPSGAYAGDCKACLHGAAVYLGGAFGPDLSRSLSEAGYTESWNDAAERTIEDVLAALDDVRQKSLEEK